MTSDMLDGLKFHVSFSIERFLLNHLSTLWDESFAFVQVGANDGQMSDPIQDLVRRNSWRGILFEPVPSLFRKLQAFYKDYPNLITIQSACGSQSDTLTFYQIKDLDQLPHKWMTGLSTFNYDVIRKHFASEEQFNSHVEQVQVPLSTLNDHLAFHNVAKCDFLVVDTEGHELEVLKGFSPDRYGTKLMMIEHQHLTGDQRAECLDIALRFGFRQVVGYFDTFYYQPDLVSPVIRDFLGSYADGILAHQ